MIPFWCACCTAWQTLDIQLQPLPQVELVLIAELGQGDSLDQFHHEVRQPRFGGPRVQHLGDVRMVHQGQRLPLGLEAGHDLAGIHPRLDDLERDAALQRMLLNRQVHHPHAPLANWLKQLVGADLGMVRRIDSRNVRRRGDHRCGRAERLGDGIERAAPLLKSGVQQPLDPSTQERVVAAGLVQVRLTLNRDFQAPRGRKQLLDGQPRSGNGTHRYYAWRSKERRECGPSTWPSNSAGGDRLPRLDTHYQDEPTDLVWNNRKS